MGFLKQLQMTETMGGFCHGPLGVAMAVGSTIMSAVGQQQAGAAAQQQANAQANLMEVQAKIDKNAAISRQNELNYEAGQATTEAGQSRAESQQQAIIQQKRTALVESRAAAVAAAGGGSTSDPGVVDIMGDLETQGRYNEKSALYSGEEKARGLEDVANIKTFEGKNAANAGATQAGVDEYSAAMDRAAGANDATIGNYKAFSTILSGGSSIAGSDQFHTLYSKYGNGGGSGYDARLANILPPGSYG